MSLARESPMIGYELVLATVGSQHFFFRGSQHKMVVDARCRGRQMHDTRAVDAVAAGGGGI